MNANRLNVTVVAVCRTIKNLNALVPINNLLSDDIETLFARRYLYKSLLTSPAHFVNRPEHIRLESGI